MNYVELNNFVTELFAADLANGDFTFNVPRKGWVHLSTSKAPWRVVGKLDGSTAYTLTYRNPPVGEAVRLLDAGIHKLTMDGATEANSRGVKIRVRAIKPIFVDARAIAALRGGVEGLETWRKHAVSAMTSACRVPAAADDPLAAIFEADFTRRGIALVLPAELPPAALGSLAYRQEGKWSALAPTDEAIRRLATDPAHAKVEALAFLPDAHDQETFERTFTMIRRYAILGETTAPKAK